MESKNKTFRLPNGLVILFEEMSWSNTFALTITVPAGSVLDPPNAEGLAALTCEMTNRGAGKYNNRRFLEALEKYGLDTSEGTYKNSTHFEAMGLKEYWQQALELLALQIMEPLLPEEEFEDCRQIQLQEILSLEDSPRFQSQKLLNQLLWPDPWGKEVNGCLESVSKLTIEDIRSFYSKYYIPNGTIIALAGPMDWEQVQNKVIEIFSDWRPREIPQITPVPSNKSTVHMESNIAQTNISLGFHSVPFGDPSYWLTLAGIEILSGGMSSRLFTEVRENRGLCYTVSAAPLTIGPYGGVCCYCGTNELMAQESLNVIIDEIDKLFTGSISDSELERMKIRTRSSLVMQRESPIKRVNSMVQDYLYLGKVRSLSEMLVIYDRITKKELEDYLHSQSLVKFKLATVGKKELQIPSERLC